MRQLFLAFALLVVATPDADARRRRAIGGERYVANGSFGIGLELGAPFGFNGKYFLSDDTALNFGIGWIEDSYYYNDRDGGHLYIDHLWHPFSIANKPAVQIPFYVGAGLRFWDFNDGRARDGYAIGIRAPVGIAFDMNRVPLDIFVQMVLGIDFFADYYRNDRVGFHLGVSVGARYWFD